MIYLFFIPLCFVVLWLVAEAKPDVLRRVVYGCLALITLFWVTRAVTDHPKERRIRYAAFEALEQTLRAGDVNTALTALETYRTTPKSRWASDYQATSQLFWTLNDAQKQRSR